MILEDSDVQRLASAIAAAIKTKDPSLTFLGLQEAADALDCSVEHVRTLVAAGHLQAIDISEDQNKRKSPRISAASIAKFAEVRRVPV